MSVRILLLSGSTRERSTNTAALRTLAALAPGGVDCVVHEGLSALPAFDPDADRDPLPTAVARLRTALAEADAVLISTPEYAGTLPGSLKNLLDWTVGGTQWTGLPTGWITVAAPGRGEGATATLALVLGYVQAEVVPALCRRVTVLAAQVGPDGLVAEPEVRAQLRHELDDLLAWLHSRRHEGSQEASHDR